MQARWLAGRGLRALVVPLVIAATMPIGHGPGAAPASICVSGTGTRWKHVPSPNANSSSNELLGVAAVSACQAWAVGGFNQGNQTLIERWNGTAWKQQPSPNPGGSSEQNLLFGAAATSATNAWAVGFYNTGTSDLTLIERWNGFAWIRQPSPNPSSTGDRLAGVTAISATNAWAVGSDSGDTLIEHRNGTAWKQVPSPSPGNDGNQLVGVAAVSPTDVWVVGYYLNITGGRHTLIEHWNGAAWKQVPSPSPGGSNDSVLGGVDATSSTDVWAVGNYFTNGDRMSRTLVEHWNGTVWKQVPSPNPGPAPGSTLRGVAAISAGNVWAVGSSDSNGAMDRTLIEHWNGTAWKQVPSPNPGASIDDLIGVAATSGTDIWAVGEASKVESTSRTLSLHCC